VTSEKAWTLDPERLQEALARWHGLNPDARSVRHVEEFLMDLVDDPFECGQEDDDTGSSNASSSLTSTSRSPAIAGVWGYPWALLRLWWTRAKL
jgi:hypothetical protein